MKMKMKTKNVNGKRAARELAEEIPKVDLADDDRTIERMLRGALPIPVRIDPSESVDLDEYEGEEVDVLLPSVCLLLDRNIDLPRGQNNIPAILELDEDLKNLGGFITILDPSRLKFSIDVENDEIKDKLMNAIYDAQDSGSIINLRIYPTKLASTPTRYTLAVNEGDAVRNVRRSIKTKQKASEEPADEELSKLKALLESEDVEIKKEKAMFAMKLRTLVMGGMNVETDWTSNGDMVVKVKRPNGIIQGVSNGAAGFANGVINGLQRLSRDRIILEADAKKIFQEYFQVENNKIKEMNFKEMRKQLMKLSESIDEAADLSRGVGRMGKRGGNKKNADDLPDELSAQLKAAAVSIYDGNGRIIEGRVCALRESSNENEIVIVARPLKRLEAGAIADIRRRNRMRRSRVTIMEGLMEDRGLM